MNSMLVFEVLRMGKLYEESWYQKWAKIANMGKFSKLYQYMYKAVLVQVQGCTGTAQKKANCTDKGPSCTGTPK